MPHKKRGHGHHKTTKEPNEHGKADTCPVDVQHRTKSSALYPTAGSNYSKSQSRQTPPKPAAQVSTVKPAQPESASSASKMATKPGVVTTTAGGSATVGAAGKETPKGKPETAPSSQDKVTPTVPPAAGTTAAASVTAPKESPKDTAKSTAASTAVKADTPKVDPAKTSKPAAVGAAAAGKVSVEGKKDEVKPTQTKVQAKDPSTAAKGAKEGPAVDAIDELAGILPSTDTVRPQPVYTGPEVRERDITPEKAQKCGERDDTLPPGYRFENMGPAPADAKPAAVPKPISTDEALDSLSAGFTSAGPDKQKEHVESISASSAAHANFAPPPVKKAETPAAVPMAAPPANKKAGVEKVSDDFSLDAGLPASSTKAGSPVAAPPADKKAKMDKTTPDVSHKAGLETKAGAKPKTEAADSMSLDALSALGDTLPADVPKPESPKLKPKDIVSEDKLKKEKGVRVGERDDTLPPEYRLKEEEAKKRPPPEPEPKMDTDDALDILSGDFSMSSVTPPVQAPVVCASAAAAQKSPAPLADKKSKVAQASDLSLEAGLSATTAKKVESAAVPPVAGPPVPSAEKKAEVHKPAAGKDTKPKTSQADSMSLDALSALGDTLPADVPKPESPKLKPKDIVSEDKVKKEKGVRVGERDDTLPPEYRLKEEEAKKLPPPEPEPKMDTDDALDILSGDFSTSSEAPPVQAPLVCSSAPPVQAKVEDLSALEVLSRDVVASSKASGVQASVPPPSKKPPEKAVCPPEQPKTTEVKPQQTKPKIEKGDSMNLDALSALGDTLPADVPKPESPKLRPEDIVSEGKVKEEKGVRVGERDDTLPPEYRPKEEDLKKLPASKPEKNEKAPKEKTMDDKTALEMLSSDFSAAPKPAAPVTSSTATTKLESPALDSKPLKPMAGPVLDSLSDTLVPDAIQAKSKTDKPKKHHTEEPSATEQVAAKQSSEVVPTSTKKGAKS